MTRVCAMCDCRVAIVASLTPFVVLKKNKLCCNVQCVAMMCGAARAPARGKGSVRPAGWRVGGGFGEQLFFISALPFLFRSACPINGRCCMGRAPTHIASVPWKRGTSCLRLVWAVGRAVVRWGFDECLMQITICWSCHAVFGQDRHSLSLMKVSLQN